MTVAMVGTVFVIVVAFFSAYRLAGPIYDFVELAPVEPHAPALWAVIYFNALPLGKH